jgi:hypothetical protein
MIGSAASLSSCVNTAPPLSGKSANPQDSQPKGHELMVASNPSIMYGATAPGPQATVYYYQDPRTGQRIASLLPPDHPQMVCLQAGEHVPETRYGFLGALCFHALLLLIGLGLCLRTSHHQASLRRLYGSLLVSVCVCSIAASNANAAASRLRKGSAANLQIKLTELPGWPTTPYCSFLVLVTLCPALIRMVLL